MTPKAKKQALADHLWRAILTLELRPGADLDEADLCNRFGLSRTPVREVFRDLDGAGLVERRDNRGVRVTELSHTTLRDFFLAAPMIYGAVLRLAARNATARQIADLKQAQKAFVAALRKGGAADRALANNAFHAVTGEMAGNVYLLPSFRRLLVDHARIAMVFYRPQSAPLAANLATASEQHEAMIAAIEAGDEEAAAALAGAHWRLSRGQIEMFVMPAALDVPLGQSPQRATA